LNPTIDAIPSDKDQRESGERRGSTLQFKNRGNDFRARIVFVRRDGKRHCCQIRVAVAGVHRNVDDVGLFDEIRVGFGVVLGLALLAPIVEFAGVSLNRGLFLMLVTMDRKVFGFLPALYGADFAV